MKQIKLMQGDNILSLKKLPENSIDSIVTDPPYGLSFMNKKWDYEVPSIEFWQEAFRVLKPGGHVLSFGGTRTYHRMVVNMEDAGFEIRDQIMWIYGSGFPKSHNIGKSFDKKNGNDREVVGIDEDFIKRNPNNTGINRLVTDENGVNKDNRKKQAVKSEDAGIITKGSSPYEGWGTALKPANEPICLARKPLSEKTIVDNVIKWGTGGINVDGCRIGTEGGTKKVDTDKCYDGNGIYGNGLSGGVVEELGDGRFPANILFDETAAEMLDEQSGVLIQSYATDKSTGGWSEGLVMSNTKKTKNYKGPNGGASRFFYVAKVGKKERNLGLEAFDEVDESKNKAFDVEGGRTSKYDLAVTKNTHPTLKPINLMTYLCRLITPPGGIILDPFMGSGSTGISACLEGFRFVGMELDEDYFKIAEARVNNFEEYRKLLK